MVTELDLAWIAGFFDGEGCITTGKERGPGDAPVRRLVVHLVQKDIAPLLWLQREFGGDVAPHNGGTAGRWRATGRAALAFLEAIRPYLRVKDARAQLAIESGYRFSEERYSELWEYVA